MLTLYLGLPAVAGMREEVSIILINSIFNVAAIAIYTLNTTTQTGNRGWTKERELQTTFPALSSRQPTKPILRNNTFLH